MPNNFFQQKLEQDERENTDYSSYFRANSQQKSFYREIHEFGKKIHTSIDRQFLDGLECLEESFDDFK